ncbi:hypothetical protein BGZ94_000459 [Podila epigama]|nr:hypothetical protein BGZ94_000459 [Podila epigama]
MRLFPICFVADKNYIYFVSNPSWKEEEYVVVSRVHLTQAFNGNAKWEIFSAKTTEGFHNSAVGINALSTKCTISTNGVLYVHVMRDWSQETHYLDINNLSGNGYNEDFDYGAKCRGDAGKNSKWSSTDALIPKTAERKERLTITNEGTLSPVAMVIYSFLADQVSRPTTPQIFILPFEKSYAQGVTNKVPTPIVLANTTGAIYDMVYGDKMLFTMIWERNGKSPDNAWTSAKKTLVYLQLDAPLDVNDANKSLVSVPWDDECTNDIFSTSRTSAVANGKFYYLCQIGNGSAEFVRLYIHDTKTNSTESYRYSPGVAHIGIVSLVPRPGSTDGDPGYIICMGSRSIYSTIYLHLPTSTTIPGTTLGYSYGAQMVSWQDFGDACYISKMGIKEYAGILGGVLVFLIGMIIFIQKQVRRRREAALKRGVQARLPGHEVNLAREATTRSQSGDAVVLNEMGGASSTGPGANDELPLHTRRT